MYFNIVYFVSAIWLAHGQLWSTNEEAALPKILITDLSFPA